MFIYVAHITNPLCTKWSFSHCQHPRQEPYILASHYLVSGLISPVLFIDILCMIQINSWPFSMGKIAIWVEEMIHLFLPVCCTIFTSSTFVYWIWLSLSLGKKKKPDGCQWLKWSEWPNNLNEPKQHLYGAYIWVVNFIGMSSVLHHQQQFTE